jgi:hypothetical protein
MSHNGPAVYDVLASRTGKGKGLNPFLPAFAFAGGKNVAEVLRENEAVG